MSQVSNYQWVANLAPAIFVAWIAYMQLKTARDKLKLDLYNRRFAIYSATVEFCQATMLTLLPEATAEQDLHARKTGNAFVKYIREAKFLFARKDGVHEFLQDISHQCAVILANSKRRDAGTAEEFASRMIVAEHRNKKILDSLIELESRMSYYLDFHESNAGWQIDWSRLIKY